MNYRTINLSGMLLLGKVLNLLRRSFIRKGGANRRSDEEEKGNGGRELSETIDTVRGNRATTRIRNARREKGAFRSMKNDITFVSELTIYPKKYYVNVPPYQRRH